MKIPVSISVASSRPVPQVDPGLDCGLVANGCFEPVLAAESVFGEAVLAGSFTNTHQVHTLTKESKMKKLLSCFAVVVLVLCFVAASSSVAVAQQRAAIGFQFASNLQVPTYGITAKTDVCVAVFLLDANGHVIYIRYGLIDDWASATVTTGKYVPVFAAYTPAAVAPYPIQRCVDLPTLGTLITDPAMEPKIWLSLAPSQKPGNINIDQANVGAIGSVTQLLSAFAAQSVSITQVNAANVTNTVGFGGVSEVTFESTANLSTLLARLSSCGTPYIVGYGYGATCDASLQP